MHIAVIIPFRGDASTLMWALEGFAAQQLPERMELEVRLCGDGVAVPQTPTADGPRISFNAISSPRIGASEAKNLLLRDRPADVVIFTNSDTRPEPDMVRIHAETLLKNPPGTMVLGDAPWEKPAHATVFDALLADSPMIFFYNQLMPQQWYDYRQTWTLNLSVRYEDFVRTGGFEKELRPVYFEDLAFGHRLLGSTRLGIFYEPAARVVHRHPTTLEQYLNREELLGLMTPVLAKVAPDVFAALHNGRSIDELAAEYRTWVSMDGASHRWVYRRLRDWAGLPESVLGAASSSETQRLKPTIYQMHIPLKRLAFRLGFLRGLELLDDAHWQERQPAGLWKRVVE